MNANAKYLLICALRKSEYDKIITYDSAKEIWDRLQTLHEETDQVKKTKISMLVHQYEIFKMLEHENIDDMTTRFMHIINQLNALGKRYSNAEMVKKILRSLSKAQCLKAIAIQEAKDLNVLSLDALIRTLKTHEIKLNEVFEESSRGGKSIALKSIQTRAISTKATKASEELEEEEEEEEESSEDKDEEEKDEIAHLAQKISKAWIKRKKMKGFPPKKDKKGKTKQNEITCYECKELRHLRTECPKLKKNLIKKVPEKKATMATWEDLDEE